MDQDDKKRQAAAAAADQIEAGMSVGIGTGSTVDFFIDALAERAQQLTMVVSSSEASTQRLAKLGIEVSELASTGTLDLYVDGADEATKHLHLLKGGGGALTREKVLASASRKFVCMIDDSKLVGSLGQYPLPVEVIPMAQSFVSRQLVKAGGQPILRTGFVTDNGNHIVDVHNLRISNPPEVENRLNQIPGVVTVGIFAQRRADILLISGDDGVREMR
ncbi:MAG: ribose-5-phosphate isomerase RpiA [Gammaproteobacteria bacterium]